MTDPSATSATPLDCLACGACCHNEPGWIHLMPEDDARVEASPVLAPLVEVTRVGGYVRHSLRMVEGACGALDRSPPGTYCRAYASRPTVCREFEAGSPDCHAARRRRGLEP